MFQRLRHSLHVARPRSITRMQKSLDHVVEAMRVLPVAVKKQGERDKAVTLRQQRETDALATQVAEMNVRIAELKKMIELLALRESQLRAVAAADAALPGAVADLASVCDTALVFLNSCGAHGSSTPDDAEPADLQRYVYQFRIGPTKAAIDALVTTLPADRRAEWEGKLIDYLV
jgi:hypothetical protein